MTIGLIGPPIVSHGSNSRSSTTTSPGTSVTPAAATWAARESSPASGSPGAKVRARAGALRSGWGGTP